jgi:hypothetical protein
MPPSYRNVRHDDYSTDDYDYDYDFDETAIANMTGESSHY